MTAQKNSLLEGLSTAFPQTLVYFNIQQKSYHTNQFTCIKKKIILVARKGIQIYRLFDLNPLQEFLLCNNQLV